MKNELRTDFAATVVRERAEVYDRIRGLLSEQTLPAVQEAKRLHLDWLQRYPDDYVALDAGEVLAMSESAFQTVQDEQSDDTTAESSAPVSSHKLNAASG